MFPYYYGLKKWCIYDNNYNINKIGPNPCKSPNSHILNNTKYIIEGGDHIYYPSKIIDAPRSQFGGRPEIFESKRLNLLNYYQILNKGLENKNLDESILKIALENNYKDVLEKIKNNLTKEELIKILMTPKNDDLNLIIAFDENFDFIKDLIDDDLLKKYLPDLLKNQKILENFKTLLKDNLKNKFYDGSTLEAILKIFSADEKLKKIFVKAPEKHRRLFKKLDENFIEEIRNYLGTM